MKTATHALSVGNQPTASLILPLKATILQQLGNNELRDDEPPQDPDGDQEQELNPAAVHEAVMLIKNDLETR